MLPRLRFVIAAALIAALPWILLASGIVSPAQNGSIGEHSGHYTAMTLATGDLRDAYRMHILAYVRRSRELERLRELASAPLSDWVASPSGALDADRAAPPAQPGEANVTEIAGLPPEPDLPPTPGNYGPQPQQPDPDSAQQQPTPDQTAEPALVPQQSPPEATSEAQSRFIPPVPRAKPTAKRKRAFAPPPRSARTRIAFRARPPLTEFNLFGAPPATATVANLFAPIYGAPQ